MNWEEYKVLSEKTLSTEFHCGKKDELLLHAVIGILTEMEEILENHTGEAPDEINREEELADGMWYVAIIAREYDIPMPSSVDSSIDGFQIILEIIKKSLKILDFLKKKLFYNKPINEKMVTQLTSEIISLFVAYANIYEISLERGLSNNIEKLKARYGDKFTSEKAINRDLITERSILSK